MKTPEFSTLAKDNLLRHGCMTLVVGTLLVTCGPGAMAIDTNTGAKGRLHRYWSLKNAFSYYGIRTPPPGFRCHVEKLNDQSSIGGWGAAQAFIAGNWVELSVCDDIQGVPIRINSWSDLWVRDPIEKGTSLRPGDTGGCSCELEPGGKVWISGEQDPGLLPDEVGSPVAVASAEVGYLGPVEFVVDYEESSLVTRITNTPYSSGVVFARSLIGPDPNPIPLNPGDSYRFLPSGELAGTGTVLVRGPEDMDGVPGEPAFLDYEIWNLCEVDATYEITVDDPEAWELVVLTPELTVAPGDFAIATVMVTSPITPGVPSNVVLVTATDMAEPEQFHADAARVVVSGSSSTDGPSLLDDAQGPHLLAVPEPNPFRDSAQIRFRLDYEDRLDLYVVDVHGRRIRTLRRPLHESSEHCVGWHYAEWDGRDETGTEAASGVYFVRMVGDGVSQSRRLILAR